MAQQPRKRQLPFHVDDPQLQQNLEYILSLVSVEEERQALLSNYDADLTAGTRVSGVIEPHRIEYIKVTGQVQPMGGSDEGSMDLVANEFDPPLDLPKLKVCLVSAATSVSSSPLLASHVQIDATKIILRWVRRDGADISSAVEIEAYVTLVFDV